MENEETHVADWQGRVATEVLNVKSWSAIVFKRSEATSATHMKITKLRRAHAGWRERLVGCDERTSKWQLSPKGKWRTVCAHELYGGGRRCVELMRLQVAEAYDG